MAVRSKRNETAPSSRRTPTRRTDQWLTVRELEQPMTSGPWNEGSSPKLPRRHSGRRAARACGIRQSGTPRGVDEAARETLLEDVLSMPTRGLAASHGSGGSTMRR